jgi:hypothetical protein
MNRSSQARRPGPASNKKSATVDCRRTTRAGGQKVFAGRLRNSAALASEVVWLGSQPGKQPAPLTQASTAARRSARSRGYSVCSAGRGKGRELLLHPLPSALRALRRFLMTCQYKFLKNMSAVGTRILEDGHGRPCSLLRFDLTDGVISLPLRGFPTSRSGKPGDPGDSWQDQKPDHQKENVN